jgi:UDP-glucose 4-epimerase
VAKVVVFGGAGFIGSHCVDRFVKRGDDVVVVDGLVAGTGGSRRNLAAVLDRIEFRPVTIGALPDLGDVLAGAAVVVDAMAWTSHLAALDDPIKDLELNLLSHLRLLQGLAAMPAPKVIYLGSRSQFGRVSGVLDEHTPMDPIDVQGIHKAAAEQHFRLAARRRSLNVVSLRLPNCFGERQPVKGSDIGLVGGFIRGALRGEAIEVFGDQRHRSLLYARDAAAIVERAASASIEGFAGVNAGGAHVAIHELAQRVVAEAGSGRVARRPLPADVRAIDAGDAHVDETRLAEMIGPPPRYDFDAALRATVAYFRESVDDLAL